MNWLKRGGLGDQSGQAVLLGTFGILILAISMMAGFRYIGPKYLLSQTASSVESGENIQNAIQAYVTVHSGMLPCPDLDGSGWAYDEPGTGTSAHLTLNSSWSTADTCAVVASTPVWGLVPWRSLHLSAADAQDRYGRRITYAVGTNHVWTSGVDFTDSAHYYTTGSAHFSINPISSGGTVTAATGALVAQASETVGSATYTKLSAQTTGAYYILVSHGANGRGAFSPTSFPTSGTYATPSQATIAATALEQLNCPRDATHMPGTFTSKCANVSSRTDYAYGPYQRRNTATSGDNTFDDVVTLGTASASCQAATPYLSPPANQSFLDLSNTANAIATADTVNAGCGGSYTVTFDMSRNSGYNYVSSITPCANNGGITVTPSSAATGFSSTSTSATFTVGFTGAASAGSGLVQVGCSFQVAFSSTNLVSSTCSNPPTTPSTAPTTSDCPLFTTVVSANGTTSPTPSNQEICGNSTTVVAGTATPPPTPATGNAFRCYWIQYTTGTPKYTLYNATLVNTGSAGSNTATHVVNIPMSGSSVPVLEQGTANANNTQVSLSPNTSACSWVDVSLTWQTQIIRAYYEVATSYTAQQGEGLTFTFLPNLGSNAVNYLTTTTCGTIPGGSTTGDIDQGSYLGYENITAPVTVGATVSAVLGHYVNINTPPCVAGVPSLFHNSVGCIQALTFTAGSGAGYFTPPSVSFGLPSNGGTTAQAFATLAQAGGKVTQVLVPLATSGAYWCTTHTGTYCQSTPMPNITFSAGVGGDTATATPVMGRTGQHNSSALTHCRTSAKTCYVASVTVTHGGTYTNTPTVTFTNGTNVSDNSQAQGTASLSQSAGISAVTLANSGSYYSSVPAVSLAGTTIVEPKVAVSLDTDYSANTDIGDGFPNQAIRHDPGVESVSLLDSDLAGPRVSIAAPPATGTQAYAVPVLGTTGCTQTTLLVSPAPALSQNCITAIVVTQGGSGYTSAPAVTITGATGAGAAATATLTGGAVTAIALNGSSPNVNNGNGYQLQHDDTFHYSSTGSAFPTSGSASASFTTYQNDPFMTNGTSGASCDSAVTAGASGPCTYASTSPTTMVTCGNYYNSSGPLTAVTVTNGGGSYTSSPTVSFSGGGGSGATATAVLASGKVSSLTLTSGGTGYTSLPTVVLSGGGGSGATAVAAGGASNQIVSPSTAGATYVPCALPTGGTPVAAVAVTNGGAGYTSTPTVGFSGGGGSGAVATATLTAGSVTKVTMTANGTGYTSAPTVAFSGGGTPTVAATGTAVVGNLVHYDQGNNNDSTTVPINYHPVRVEAVRYCNSTCSACGATATPSSTYMLVRVYYDCPINLPNGHACSDVTQSALIGTAAVPGTMTAIAGSIPAGAKTLNYCVADPGANTQVGVAALNSVILGWTTGAGPSAIGSHFVTNLNLGAY